ncbi:hypothetical protein [Arthrobacter sp. C152]
MGYYLEEHPNPNTAQYGWPRNRVSGVIGVHTTESGVIPSGADPGAENTAAFIARRTDYGSYHIIADWDTIVPMTRPTFAAWADTTNNVHAMSVSGAMDAARWRDIAPDRAAGIVKNMGVAAAMLVRDAIAHGVLDAPPPAQRITAQQAINGTAAGFYGHGETNPGTRYDPGTNFDWDLFLATYAAAVGTTTTGITYQSTTITPLEDDVSAQEVLSWPIERTDGQDSTVAVELARINPKQDETLSFLQGMNEKLDEVVGNARKTFWNSEESKNLLANTPAPDLAAKIDAAGLAAAVRDELVKILEGK